MKHVGNLALGLAIIVASCSNPTESPEYKSLQQTRDSLSAQINAKDQEVEDLAASINEIENNLSAIEQDKLSINQINKEGQQAGQKDKINSMIANIDNYIEQNRQKIETLEQKVKKSGGRNAALQRLVASLRASIEKKEGEIADLRSTVSGLETEVTGLKDQVGQRDRSITQRDSALMARQQMIEERDTEIYTAYYMFGNKKELEKSGIIDKKGGFLGLGKTAAISGKLDKSKFTRINMRETDDINLGVTKKKNVISSHPADSYYTTMVGEEVHLKITDYRKFWSNSKFLVIETK